jgi:putative ubiquitin-RnfH superfamily antitoxin RatB of RatAB toxin-antitoxin module
VTDVRIEVVYAEATVQTVVSLTVPAGTTVAEAVRLAHLGASHPQMPADLTHGIWGREVAPDTPVSAGDRVELYRPLPNDPKETRRALAREGRTMGQGVAIGHKRKIRRKVRR